MASTNERISAIAFELSQLVSDLPENDVIVDTLDYVAGAVYSLSRCERYPLWDRRGPRLTGYREKLITYIAGIAKAEDPGEYWLAGYYLNSALQRIAGAYDRIPKLILGIRDRDERPAHKLMETVFGNEKNYMKWKAIHGEMNPLKHWAIGLAEGRKVGKEEAVQALEEMMSLIKSKRGLIESQYSKSPENCP